MYLLLFIHGIQIYSRYTSRSTWTSILIFLIGMLNAGSCTVTTFIIKLNQATIKDI